MRWYRKLYMGKLARKQRFRIVSFVKRKKTMQDVFLITLATNPNNLLDIYPSDVLIQPFFEDRDIFILGIAVGKGEALELTQTILDEVYQATGTTQVRSYFEARK